MLSTDRGRGALDQARRRVDKPLPTSHPPECLACNYIVNRGRHGLLELNSKFVEDWYQSRSKGVEIVL